MVNREKQQREGSKLPGGKVYLFPTLQFNVVGLREDEETFLKVLDSFREDSGSLASLRMATGYLNLQDEFSQAMIDIL